MAKRFLRIEIIPTRRTDLPCAGCGCFRTEFAIVPVTASEPPRDADAHAGVHRACIDNLHMKRGS